MGFEKATKKVAYAKIGTQGKMGSGKTTLLLMLALYLSKKHHGGAPIAFLDSEKGSDFALPICETEGVELLVNRTRAFVDLKNASKEAIAAGACALIGDSISHYWTELAKALKAEKNVKRLDVQLIQRLKDEWGPFAEDFVTSPIHYLVAGRLGYEWENAEYEEDGKIRTELLRGGTKMKAEGEFGHEPDLIIEMASVEDPDAIRFEKLKGKVRKKHKSTTLHVGTVKKCRVWSLNGKSFSWPDADAYKPGDYMKVAQCFLPFFDFLNIGGEHHALDASRNSRALFQGADNPYYRNTIARKAALEEWDATITKLWPGQDAKAKSIRAAVFEAVTTTRSRTKFEALPLDQVQFCVRTIFALEQRLVENPNAAGDEVEVLKLVDRAREVAGSAPSPAAEEMQGASANDVF